MDNGVMYIRLIKLYCPKCKVEIYIPKTPSNEKEKNHIHEYCGSVMKIIKK